MDSHTMAHRWTNQDFGRNNGFKSKNTHCDKWNYYSYSTVIAQWVDHKRKVMVVMDLHSDTTPTTNNHRQDIYSGVSDEITVFPYTNYSYSYYDGGQLTSSPESFDYTDRRRLLEYYLQNMYNAYAEFVSSKKLTTLNFTDYWKYADKLCEMYKDTTYKKWLRNPSALIAKNVLTAMRKMVKLHIAGVTATEEFVNTMFGDGTWDAYMTRTESIRKSARTREYIAKVNYHVGYERWYSRCNLPYHSMAEIKADGPRKILLRKFAKLWHDANDNKICEKKKQSIVNATKYLGISDIQSYELPSVWSINDYRITVRSVIVDGEVVYKPIHCMDEWRILGWCNVPVLEFRYKEFKAAKDTKKFKERYIKKATILGRLQKGKSLYIKVLAKSLKVEDLTEEQTHLYNEFVAFHEKELGRIDRRKKIRKQEEARIAAEKAAKLEVYKSRGVDGMRDLWREHLCSIYEYDRLDNYYYGGNVLLRWSKNHDYIETSKNIKLSIEQCKKYWKIISIWHENLSKFKSIQMATKTGTYKVTSYQDDILTAGCHKIAYQEMKRMMKEILGDAA
jgi:hypothetical protein|nr:MAG TPA: hypothetical protein [Caudoviricetes sp.]